MDKQFRDQVTDKRKLLNDAARERMIGWLALQGYVPVLRRAGDMKQLKYVAIQAPAEHESVYELVVGSVQRGTLMPLAWVPAQWGDISDRLLNAFYLQVNNNEP